MQGGFNMANESKFERARMNIYIAKELKEFVDSQAASFGMSSSAYMTMIIQNYRMQLNAMTAINGFNDSVNLLKEQEGK